MSFNILSTTPSTIENCRLYKTALLSLKILCLFSFFILFFHQYFVGKVPVCQLADADFSKQSPTNARCQCLLAVFGIREAKYRYSVYPDKRKTVAFSRSLRFYTIDFDGICVLNQQGQNGTILYVLTVDVNIGKLCFRQSV